MKFNKWTVGLAAIGVVSLASAARADEKMSQVQTALSNTTLSGYVDTSAMWQLGSQNGGDSPTYTPGNVKGDGFNLDSIDIALDHPEDESPWAAGYHVELMFGPDAVPAANATGGSFVSTGGFGSIRQAYLSLRTPIGNSGIDWKVGVWDTIIGYESSSDPANPNFTRSYGWSLEPTTETGILGTYKVNDEVTVEAGIANSWNTGGPGFIGSINNRAAYETQKAYMGGVSLTAPSSWGWLNGATFNAGVIQADNGSASDQSTASAGKTSLYAGGTIPTPLTALKVGAAFDFVDYHNGKSGTVEAANDSAWALGGYASYQLNDKASVNLRGELADLSSADSHNMEEVTATLQYALWANVLSRVELRWDHDSVDAFDDNSDGDGPIHKNAYLAALNLIYQF